MAAALLLTFASSYSLHGTIAGTRPACHARCCAGDAPPCRERLPRRDVTRLGCSAACAAAAAAALPLAAAAGSPPKQPIPVTDQDGETVTAASWLAAVTDTDGPDLVLGLDGEPYFLLTTSAPQAPAVRPYALKAECTHLGCLVQFDFATGGFACPCHGSKYATDGSVTRGPAPRSLGLARVTARADGVLTMERWEGADFRAG